MFGKIRHPDKPKRKPSKIKAIKISKGKNVAKTKVKPKKVKIKQDKPRTGKVSLGNVSTAKKGNKVRKRPKIFRNSETKLNIKPIPKTSKQLLRGKKTPDASGRVSLKATMTHKKLRPVRKSESFYKKKINELKKFSSSKRKRRLRKQQLQQSETKHAQSGSGNEQNVNRKLEELNRLASDQGYLTVDDFSEILSEFKDDPALIAAIKEGLRKLEIEAIDASSVDRCKEITVDRSDADECKTNPRPTPNVTGESSSESRANNSSNFAVCQIGFPLQLHIDSARLQAASEHPKTRAVNINRLNISARAFNVLSALGFTCLGHLIDAVRLGFRLGKVRNVGKKTYEEIANIILSLNEALYDSGNINWLILNKQVFYDLDAVSKTSEFIPITIKNQKFPRIFYNSDTLSSLDASVRDLHIGNLHLDLKAALFFDRKGIKTVGGVIDHIKDGIDFSKERNLGKVAFHDIINCASALENCLNSGTVDWTIYARLRCFPVLPDGWNSTQKVDLAEIAELVRRAVMAQYCEHAGASGNRFLDILENRILRANSEKLSLEEVSEKHGITRERIRQNELDIYRVLRGALVDKLYSVRSELDSRVRFDCIRFRFQPGLEEIFANAKRALSSCEILNFSAWSQIVSRSTGFSESQIRSYNYFLASMLGFEVRYMSFSRNLSDALVYNENLSNKIIDEIIELLEDIHLFFEDKPESISIEEVKKVMPCSDSLEKSGFSLQKILDLCPTIIASQDDADKWQTRDEFYKPNVGKLILNEAEKILASNKERMHFQDLFRKIKNQFPQIDIPERYLSAKLHYDPRFNCIAKKGYWFLTEWNYQTGSILECLLIILKDATDSMTLNELVVEVQKMNPSKPGSIKVTLQNRSDVFIKLPGNRYDLRERYPNRSKSDDEF
jgi:DNA-directed RNA polymerase delta subunit